MRIMAVDYGEQRTGVAFSDLTGSIAGEAFVVAEWNADRLAEKLASEAKARDVSLIVVGHPLKTDGTSGGRAELSEAFCGLLEAASGLPCLLWDERFTTVDAHRILHQNGRREKEAPQKRGRRRGHADLRGVFK